MTVEVNVEPEESPSDDAPDVVVVDTGDSGGDGGDVDAALVEVAVEQAAETASLEERVSALEVRVAEAQFTAEVAENTAEVAIDIAETPVIEETVEVDTDPEDDEPPVKVHWMHKSFGDLFRKND